jgi:hypothetical protein
LSANPTATLSDMRDLLTQGQTADECYNGE